MTDIGVPLIGAGMIAKSHVSALSELKARCQLHAIISTRPERADYLSDYMNIHWRDGRSKYFKTNTLNKQAGVAKSEWHRRVIQDFLDCVENDREPLVTGAEALAVHQLIDAVERSSRNGIVVQL